MFSNFFIPQLASDADLIKLIYSKYWEESFLAKTVHRIIPSSCSGWVERNSIAEATIAIDYFFFIKAGQILAVPHL